MENVVESAIHPFHLTGQKQNWQEREKKLVYCTFYKDCHLDGIGHEKTINKNPDTTKMTAPATSAVNKLGLTEMVNMLLSMLLSM